MHDHALQQGRAAAAPIVLCSEEAGATFSRYLAFDIVNCLLDLAMRSGATARPGATR
jgi:hypothetical protein